MAVHFDTREMSAVMRALTSQEQDTLLQRSVPLVRRHLHQAEGRIKANVSGPILQVRSGTLRSAVGIEGPTIAAGQMVGHVGVTKESPARVYAGFLIRGGIVRPRKGKYLAIPLAAAKTRSGVARGGPRDFSPTAVFKSRAGNLIIWLIHGRGKSRRIEPLFVLKRSVTVPPHDYLSGPQAQLTEEIARDLPALVVQTLIGKG